MTIFNISNITYGDTFEQWYNITNDNVDALNQIILLNAQADTTQGLEETYRNGGVVIFGVSTGSGLGFDTDGRLTIAYSGVTTGTRTAVDDIILMVQTDGSIKGVSGTNMIPPQVDNDINFTGDIAFSGDLSFITSGSVVLSIDTSFRDKELELAVNFDDELEFATCIDVDIATNAYLVDTTVVTDFAAFSTSADQIIGSGVVQAYTDPVITVTDFVFGTVGDAFTEFTVAGATFGGRYALIGETGNTIGRGLIDHTATIAPAARQTSPLVASGAGLIVKTDDDGVIPTGGSAGEKLLLWIWNGTSADSAWTSSENIQISSNRSLINSNFISPTDYYSKIAQSTFVFDKFTYDIAATHGYAEYYNASADTFAIGPFTATSTISPSLTFARDRTITAGTTGVASDFNADLLDGAHGATVGGTPNTIAITGDDGLIDSTFLPGSGRIEEIISQTSHGLATGACVRQNASSDFVPAIAATEGTADAVGIVTEVLGTNSFRLTYFGVVEAPEIYGFSFGLGYDDGITVALDPGDVYYLSESISGGVSESKPAADNSVTKPMFIALGDQKLLITNYNGRPSPTGDTINIQSVVPVGSISYVGNSTIGSNTDFISCDGKVYSSDDYPDLKTAIQGQFYLDGVATGGESSMVIYGTDSELRNFAVGQTFQLKYNSDANTLNITLTSVSGISSGVEIGFSAASLSGSTFYDDVELRGTGSYFVVPDLRSRGVVGSGDPDGDRSEDDLEHGDIVGTGGVGDDYWNLPDTGTDITTAEAAQLDTDTVTKTGLRNGLYRVSVGGCDRVDNSYKYFVQFDGGSDVVGVFHQGGEFSDPLGGNGSVSALVRVVGGSLTVTVESNTGSSNFIDWWNGYRVGN